MKTRCKGSVNDKMQRSTAVDIFDLNLQDLEDYIPRHLFLGIKKLFITSHRFAGTDANWLMILKCHVSQDCRTTLFNTRRSQTDENDGVRPIPQHM